MAPEIRSLLAVLLLCPPLLGCPPEYEPAPQARVLTSVALLDAGAVAVGERRTLGLELRSQGAAPVTITDIAIEHQGDEEPFVLLPWDDGSGRLELARGSEAAPTIAVAQISYRPEQAGIHRALLTVTSTDTQVEGGQWHVALRGLSMHPCASISPVWHDFGPRSSGSYTTASFDLANCGLVELTVSGFDLSDSSTFSVLTADPVYVEAGASETIDLAWVPSNTQPDGATLSLLANAPDHSLVVELLGNDCERSAHPGWDDDGDGWFSCAGDCDDDDALVNPSAVELANGVDDDCDGETDEAANPTSTDDDDDGWTEDAGDCDDADPTVHPGVAEQADGIDGDCNGIVDDNTERLDDDGDGFSELAGDCDDADSGVYPGADEPRDGMDNDCDGLLDEGSAAYDDDGDGYSEDAGDCDDDDPWTHPQGAEDCDGVDNDCDGETDEADACAYLAERTVDTGLGEPRGCSSAPGGGAMSMLLALLALLGITRKDAPRPM